jgi:hypothetical protein
VTACARLPRSPHGSGRVAASSPNRRASSCARILRVTPQRLPMPGAAKLGRPALWLRRASELPGGPCAGHSRPGLWSRPGVRVGAALGAAPRGPSAMAWYPSGAEVRDPGLTDTFLRAQTRSGDNTTAAEVVVSSVRAGTRPPDALSPRVGTPGVTRHYQRFGRPSPFHPLFEDRARYAGNSEIQHSSGIAGDGETRTRTGDTTIFRRREQ